MIKLRFFFIFISASLFENCTEKNNYEVRAFYSNGSYVGDSIFLNYRIKKIVFSDRSYKLDSIVYERFDNPGNSIKSIQSFMKGHIVFENIYYYENGKIKKYLFLDEVDSSYFYKREYDQYGKVKNSGNLFFQGYTTNIRPSTGQVKLGTTVQYSIFCPSPPDCITEVYIKFLNGDTLDVFRKNAYLPFLYITYGDNNVLGNFRTDIWTKITDIESDTAMFYNNPIIFDVVK